MAPDRLHSDTAGRVANKVRVKGGEGPLTSTFRNIALLTHFLRQRFFIYSQHRVRLDVLYFSRLDNEHSLDMLYFSRLDNEHSRFWIF